MKERIAFGSSPNPDRLDRGGLGPSGAVAPILVGHHPTMQESATSSLASQEHTQRSGRATTKPQVRDRPDRLNDATQNPQRLGTAHLRTRTPG